MELTGRRFSSFGQGLSGSLEHGGAGAHRRIARRPSRDRGADRGTRRADGRAAGLVEEVRRLAAAPWSRTARQAIGYKEVLDHVQGRVASHEDRAGRDRDAHPPLRVPPRGVVPAGRSHRVVRRRHENPTRSGHAWWHGGRAHDQIQQAPRDRERLPRHHHARGRGRRRSRLCDRFTGVGADGVLVLGPGVDGADATMTLTNADGSGAEMSGNGARCLACGGAPVPGSARRNGSWSTPAAAAGRSTSRATPRATSCTRCATWALVTFAPGAHPRRRTERRRPRGRGRRRHLHR